MNASGHTLARLLACSQGSEQAWEPMASSSVIFCRKTSTGAVTFQRNVILACSPCVGHGTVQHSPSVEVDPDIRWKRVDPPPVTVGRCVVHPCSKVQGTVCCDCRWDRISRVDCRHCGVCAGRWQFHWVDKDSERVHRGPRVEWTSVCRLQPTVKVQLELDGYAAGLCVQWSCHCDNRTFSCRDRSDHCLCRCRVNRGGHHLRQQKVGEGVGGFESLCSRRPTNNAHMRGGGREGRGRLRFVRGV
jgi:hypothetical protein